MDNLVKLCLKNKVSVTKSLTNNYNGELRRQVSE